MASKKLPILSPNGLSLQLERPGLWYWASTALHVSLVEFYTLQIQSLYRGTVLPKLSASLKANGFAVLYAFPTPAADAWNSSGSWKDCLLTSRFRCWEVCALLKFAGHTTCSKYFFCILFAASLPKEQFCSDKAKDLTATSILAAGTACLHWVSEISSCWHLYVAVKATRHSPLSRRIAFEIWLGAGVHARHPTWGLSSLFVTLKTFPTRFQTT